jgi:hypothetical protein
MAEVFEDTTLRGMWRKGRATVAEREFPKIEFSRGWAAAATTEGRSDDLPTKIPGSD